ncbi:FtsX-like permease family protein [Massilia sp. W12]|uniref:ABC transporter permease n=1 Tax=Massilia sp. W12 TaxID=3126507 RepID=UPI0030CC3996
MRDWRAGQLRFLLAALTLAVAALSAVGFFTNRIERALLRDGAQTLAADVLLSAPRPLPPEWRNQAREAGLQVSATVIFPSMAQSLDGEQSILASVKAVDQGYPLRGRLKLTEKTQDMEGAPAQGIPGRGEIWLDQDVLERLQLKVGARLRLGDSEFTISRIIRAEPDRGASFMNFAPRVMINLADLAATGLEQPGARIGYRMLLAGAEGQALAFAKQIETRIEQQKIKGVRIESLNGGQRETRNTLDRARAFLSLVGMLAGMLAALAIALAARRFALRQIDSVAMLRFFGLAQRQVLQIYVIEFLLLGLAASLLGALIGFLAHFALTHWLAGLITSELPPLSLLPAAQALLLGLVFVAGFALPPLLQLADVPHNRVLRRDTGAPKAGALAVYGMGVAAFLGLMLWQAGDLLLGLLVSGGFAAACAIFAGVAWLMLRVLRSLRHRLPWPSWRYALTSLQRRPGATVLQVTSLALGLFAILLLTTERNDLLQAWSKNMPADAPNRFLINVQPDQVKEVDARIDALAPPQRSALYPMYRGRLTALNGKAVNGKDYENERARNLVEREFNLSAFAALPPDNQISAGAWFGPQAKAEASVESGLAKTLTLKLGDTMEFDVGGLRVPVKITSLRKLDWNAMRINFFVIMSPDMLGQITPSYATAFHLRANQSTQANALTRDFPNLTLIDVSLIQKQARDILQQVANAVEFLFLFTLAAGVLVLYAALLGSQEERMREAALLRALGASARQLWRAQLVEFLLIGSVAGVLAAAAAGVLAGVLALLIFEFPWEWGPQSLLVGSLLGAICAIAGGVLGLRGILQRPPLSTLREI